SPLVERKRSRGSDDGAVEIGCEATLREIDEQPSLSALRSAAIVSANIAERIAGVLLLHLPVLGDGGEDDAVWVGMLHADGAAHAELFLRQDNVAAGKWLRGFRTAIPQRGLWSPVVNRLCACAGM